MLVLIIIVMCFIPSLCSASNVDVPKGIKAEKAIAWLPIVALITGLFSAVYSYYTMRKMQKKNRPEPSQLDGSLADEGISFSDIAGKPFLHGNIVWKGNESAEAIKAKGGKK